MGCLARQVAVGHDLDVRGFAVVAMSVLVSTGAGVGGFSMTTGRSNASTSTAVASRACARARADALLAHVVPPAGATVVPLAEAPFPGSVPAPRASWVVRRVRVWRLTKPLARAGLPGLLSRAGVPVLRHCSSGIGGQTTAHRSLNGLFVTCGWPSVGTELQLVELWDATSARVQLSAEATVDDAPAKPRLDLVAFTQASTVLALGRPVGRPAARVSDPAVLRRVAAAIDRLPVAFPAAVGFCMQDATPSDRFPGLVLSRVPRARRASGSSRGATGSPSGSEPGGERRCRCHPPQSGASRSSTATCWTGGASAKPADRRADRSWGGARRPAPIRCARGSGLLSWPGIDGRFAKALLARDVFWPKRVASHWHAASWSNA